MKKVFIDTWGWIAYINRRDDHHDAVKTTLEMELMRASEFFTSHSVIAETINHIVRCGEKWMGGKEPMRETCASFKGFIDNNFINIIFETESDFHEILSIAHSSQTIKGMSYTDYLSCVLMRKNRIKTIITNDDHFRQIGMDFQLLP